MGCRPSRSSLGRVADSSWEYNRKYAKDQKEKKLKSKKSGRGGRRKAPVYNDFSCTSKTYTHHNSKSSKITVRLSTDGSTLEIEQFDIDLNACVDRYKNTIIPTILVQSTQARTPETWQNCIPGHGQWIVRSHSAPQLTCVTSITKSDYVNGRDKVCSKSSCKAGSSSKPKKSKSVSEKGFLNKGNDLPEKLCAQSNDLGPGYLPDELRNMGHQVNTSGIVGFSNYQNNLCDGGVHLFDSHNDSFNGPGCSGEFINRVNVTKTSCNNERTCSEIIELTDLDQNCENDCDSSSLPISNGAPIKSIQSSCNCSKCSHPRAARKCNNVGNWLISETDYVCSCSKVAVQSETNSTQPNSRLNKFREHEICGNKHKSISDDVNQNNRSGNVQKHISADENLNFSQSGKFEWCKNTPLQENDNLSIGYLNSLDSEGINRLVSDIDYCGRNVLLPTTLTNEFKNGDNCLTVQSPIAESILPSNSPDIPSNNEDMAVLSRGNHLVLTNDKHQNSDDSFTCCKTTNLKENLVAIETTDKLVGLSEGTNCVSGVPADFVFLMNTGPIEENEINTDINLEMVRQEVESLENQRGAGLSTYILSDDETDETSPEYEESLDESFEKRFDFSFYNYDMLKIPSPIDVHTNTDDTSSSDFDDDEFLDALESTYV